MDSQSIATPARLRIRASDWRRLSDHLFPGDGDEHGAVLLCGVRRASGRNTLIVREVVTATDGEDYVPGVRGYRHLTGEFVTHQIRRARDLGLAYLAVHNHGGENVVDFSGPDMASHDRAYPTLLKVLGNPVGGVVCARNALAGDVWYPSGERGQIGEAIIVGDRRIRLTPGIHRATTPVRPAYHRQALLYGDTGQAILADTTVAVVGCGGVGMLITQAVARLGVGRIIVVDPDRVSVTNLPRLPEATRWDAMEFFDRTSRPAWIRRWARRRARLKVEVARRLVHRANRAADVIAIAGDIGRDDVAQRILDADFIFLAADTMIARDVVNQIANQYLIPTLQVGSKVTVDPATGSVVDAFAVVRHVGFTSGCLRCNGLIDLARLGEEALGDPAQVQRQRYVDDPDVTAPSVITLNALGIGFAVNDFMLHTVGLGGAEPAHRVLRNRPLSERQQHVTVIEPDESISCPVCSRSDHSTFAVGDRAELPTRIGEPIGQRSKGRHRKRPNRDTPRAPIRES